MGAGWMNIGSIMLGLAAWILPFVGISAVSRGRGKNASVFLIASLISCSAALCLQILYTDYLVKIEDWSALMDTSHAVSIVSVALIAVTAVLNICAYSILRNDE